LLCRTKDATITRTQTLFELSAHLFNRKKLIGD